MQNRIELELKHAIDQNNFGYVEIVLVSKDLDLRNRSFPRGSACIHYASQKGCLEIVKLLLKKDPGLLNYTDKNNQTPILWAARRGFKELVSYLAEQGADLNCATDSSVHQEHNRAPIHWAIERGYKDIVRILIDHGASIDIRCYDDLHLIHLATLFDYREIASTLLKRNPECVNYQDIDKKTPLMYAVEVGSEVLVQQLVALGADLKHAKAGNEDEYDYGFLPIHYAIENGYMAIFKYLFKCMSGSDFGFGMAQKKYIHLASFYGQLEILQYLLKQDPAAIESPDVFNSTPLMYAAANDSFEIVKFLVEKGVNTHIVTINPDTLQHGRCAIYWAIANKAYRCANFLLLHHHAKKEASAIFNHMQIGIQVLNLMLEEPSFIPLVLQNEKMLHLISNSSACKNTANTIEWYEKGGRRASFYASINKTTNTASRFTFSKEISHGTFGVIRRFQTAEGEVVAVKAPMKGVVHVGFEKENLRRESTFTRLAYPNDNYASTFEFEDDDTYTNRYVMPFIPGDVVHVVMSSITCEYQLATLILQIAKELQRIHSLGFLHRDIHSKNILIAVSKDAFQVRFIDFALSCWLTEEVAEPWIIEDNRWYPPELCTKSKIGHSLEKLSPNVNQDIYSFGYLLKNQLSYHPVYARLVNTFPFIADFIMLSLDNNPKNRPALEAFCETLQDALASQSQGLSI